MDIQPDKYDYKTKVLNHVYGKNMNIHVYVLFEKKYSIDKLSTILMTSGSVLDIARINF